MNIFLWR